MITVNVTATGYHIPSNLKTNPFAIITPWNDGGLVMSILPGREHSRRCAEFLAMTERRTMKVVRTCDGVCIATYEGEAHEA